MLGHGNHFLYFFTRSGADADPNTHYISSQMCSFVSDGFNERLGIHKYVPDSKLMKLYEI